MSRKKERSRRNADKAPSKKQRNQRPADAATDFSAKPGVLEPEPLRFSFS